MCTVSLGRFVYTTTNVCQWLNLQFPTSEVKFWLQNLQTYTYRTRFKEENILNLWNIFLSNWYLMKKNVQNCEKRIYFIFVKVPTYIPILAKNKCKLFSCSRYSWKDCLWERMLWSVNYLKLYILRLLLL